MVTENRENVNNAAAVDGGVNNETLADIVAEIEVNAAPLPAVMLTHGNAAAMREAVEKVIEILNREWDAHRETSAMWEIQEICTAALAAPARNCDRFSSVKEAAMAFAAEVKDKPHPCPDFTFSAWLFVPATKKEGGNNADKQ